MNNFFINRRESVAIALAGLASVLLVSGIVYSASTISTDISTGGTLGVSGLSTLSGFISTASSTVIGQANASTLSVTGASTLTGAVYASSTLQATGNALLYGTLGVATTSPFSLSGNALSVHGGAYISGNLNSVSNITATGTLTVTGLSTLGFASSTGISISTGANSLMVSGTATTTGSSGQFATQGFIGAGGTSTPAAELSATSAATTTLYLDTSGTKKGSCIELVSATSTVYRLYIGASDTATTSAIGNGRNGAMLALLEPGSCK